MPETRRWVDFLEGRLNEALEIDGTTLTSEGLRQLGDVTAPEHLTVVIDPAAGAGPQEIIYITEHTAGENIATVSRGMESTSVRRHKSGVFWMHSLVASDMNRINEVFIQDEQPIEGVRPDTYLWIQTGLGDGSGVTFWVEDGT